jgi:hypothetical protein
MDFWFAVRYTELPWPDAHHLYLSVLRLHVKKGTARRSDLIDYEDFLNELRRPLKKEILFNLTCLKVKLAVMLILPGR